MLAILVADVTDTPVWFLFAATVGLGLVTLALVIAAWRALDELEVGVRQLEVTVKQLEEVKKDRHVDVFLSFGIRWDEAAMSEALERESNYSRADLERMVELSQSAVSPNPIKKRARRRAERELVVLKRVPNYFEDLSLVTQTGALDIRLVGKNFKTLVAEEWELWELAMTEFRKVEPSSYKEFEWLVEQMRELAEE
jgi:hypothetical protein